MVVSHRTTKIGAAIVVLAGAALATVAAQGRAQGLESSSAGSLAELKAEVRQLRMTIQDTGRTQTQVSALGMAITTQQTRLFQVTARLDKLEDDLQVASKKTEAAMREVADAQARLARPAPGEDRAGLARQVEWFKEQAAPFVAEENRIRARQQELMAAYRADEARWFQLVAKLEEIVKR